MRRALLPILLLALPALVVATWWTWQHRFEIDPSQPSLGLRDLKPGLVLNPGVSWEQGASGNPSLRLTVTDPARPVVQTLPLPFTAAVGFLRFDFKVKAHDLVPGPEKWADGRLMLEWHPPGRAMEAQYLVSSRSTHAAGSSCLVARAEHGPAVPVLRLEHLGASGGFELVHCRIDVVRESAWWRSGRWLLLGGWFAWAAALAGRGRTSGPGRPLLAAAVWLFCATQWAVPGPWQAIRPMAAAFATGAPASRAVLPVSTATPPAPRASPAVAAPSSPARSLGELPFGGSLVLEIKDRIKQARPVFHAMLFFGPALVFAFLVGRGKAVLLTVLLAGAIEWSQHLFGYGFDASDLADLSFDALGVALALWLHAGVSRWWEKRKTAGEPAAVSAGEPA